MAFHRHRRPALPTRLAVGALVYLGSLLLGLAVGAAAHEPHDDRA